MKSPTHTIYFHHDFQSLIVESRAHSVHPVYPDHVPRIQNQSKVNPHATPPKPQLTFKALGNAVTPLFLIILLRLHPPMKRLAPHRAQAVPWLPGILSFHLSTTQGSLSIYTVHRHLRLSKRLTVRRTCSIGLQTRSTNSLYSRCYLLF